MNSQNITYSSERNVWANTKGTRSISDAAEHNAGLPTSIGVPRDSQQTADLVRALCSLTSALDWLAIYRLYLDLDFQFYFYSTSILLLLLPLPTCKLSFTFLFPSD